ncbi:MAG: lysophospholipid acyltransferase family protein [Longimicrobiales bacterium]|nr:lysophospholipid acyltransferase family protein [Longimicrobiales bacterium]
MTVRLREVKRTSVGVLGQGLVAGLFLTVRFDNRRYQPIQALRSGGEQVIFTLWHGGLLPLAYRHRDEGIVVLVSEHEDGEYITRVLHRYGYGTARGSSTRGGTRGLRSLLASARRGHDLGITPDGPRGPAGQVKPGVVTVARLSGLPIVPIGVGGSGVWHFQSWDRFLVPQPFSTLRLVYGDPIRVPRELPPGREAAYVARVQRALEEATADATVGQGWAGVEETFGGERDHPGADAG